MEFYFVKNKHVFVETQLGFVLSAVQGHASGTAFVHVLQGHIHAPTGPLSGERNAVVPNGAGWKRALTDARDRIVGRRDRFLFFIECSQSLPTVRLASFSHVRAVYCERFRASRDPVSTTTVAACTGKLRFVTPRRRSLAGDVRCALRCSTEKENRSSATAGMLRNAMSAFFRAPKYPERDGVL